MFRCRSLNPAGLAMFLLSLAPTAAAVEPEWKIYTPGNTGLQGNYCESILFDNQGHLWAAANDPVWDEGGLAKFDGGRWWNWSNVDGACPSFELQSLTQDADGNIWAGSTAGLLKFDGSSFTVYDTSNSPLVTNWVRDVAIDASGNVWFAMNDYIHNIGGLGRFDGTTFTIWTRATGIPWPAPWNGVESVACGPGGMVYLGSDVVGAARFDGVQWKYYDPWGPNPPPSNQIGDIVVEPDGVVWMSDRTSTGRGIGRLAGSTWTYFNPPGTRGISCLKLDAGGDLWVGTYGTGVWRLSGGSWISLGWPGSHVYTIAVDLDGVMWAGGIGGVARNDGGTSWTQYGVANTGLTSRWINGLFADRDNHMWFATLGGGVCEFDGVTWKDFNPYNHGAWPWSFPTDVTRCVDEDASGNAWVSLYGQGMGIWDGLAWTHLRDYESVDLERNTDGVMWLLANGIRRWDGSSWVHQPLFGAHHLAADGRGNMWVCAASLYKFDADGDTLAVFPPGSGYPGSGGATDVAVAPDGTVWLGTTGGLARFDGNGWTLYNSANSPLPNNSVLFVEVTSDNVVWVACTEYLAPIPGAVVRFDGVNWAVYSTLNSPLPHWQIYDLEVDRFDDVWVSCASEGVARIREHSTTTEVAAQPDGSGGRHGEASVGVLRIERSFRSPFREETAIRFELARAATVAIGIFDPRGRLVATPASRALPAGSHEIAWDGRNSGGAKLASGFYFYRLNAGGESVCGKLVISR